MYFRPYFWLSVCALPALIILILLGSWQVQRLSWKTGLIDEYRARALAPAIALPDADISLDNFRFQRLALTGRFLNDKEIYINGRTYEGNAGFHWRVEKWNENPRMRNCCDIKIQTNESQLQNLRR